MGLLDSFNSSGGIVNGKTVQSIGNIDVSYRRSIDEKTFSVYFINKMNYQSMTLHRFDKSRFIVEFGAHHGVEHVVSFKSIEPAAEIAVLNTDITRINEDDAIKARRVFIGCISMLSGRNKHIEFPERIWKINKFRNNSVIFDNENGVAVEGVLNVILPPSGSKCLITPKDDKKTKVIIETDKIWIK